MWGVGIFLFSKLWGGVRVYGEGGNIGLWVFLIVDCGEREICVLLFFVGKG